MSKIDAKLEVKSLKPGDVVVVTVDVGNLPQAKIEQMLEFMDTQSEMIQQIREQGNLVAVVTNRVKVDVISYTPKDRVIVYADCAKLPANKADDFLRYMRSNFEKVIPGNQLVITPKEHKVTVQKGSV